MNAIAAATLLGEGKVVLFCGAGISQDPPAGLPDWGELRDFTIEAVGRRDPVPASYITRLTSVEMLAQPAKRGMTPELVASVLADASPHYFESLRALHDGTPNANHESVAALAAQGHLRYVVTTNFDLFLEKALETNGVSFRSYRGAEEFRTFDPNDQTVVHLLKIHGCISAPQTITATVEQEGGGLRPPIRAALDRLLVTHWFLFWGYSGADLKIDLDYLGMVSLAERAQGFLWSCFRSGDYQETPHPLVVQLAGMYGDRAVVAAGLAPDAIQAALPAYLRPAAPPLSLEDVAAWKQAKRDRLVTTLDEWATHNINGATACRAIGDLLNVEAARIEAIACYRRMGDLARASSDLPSEAQAATLTGAVLREMGQFIEAYAELKTSDHLARQAGSWQPLYSALFEFGTLCSAWGRHPDALAAWREAETLFASARAGEGVLTVPLPVDLREALARAYLRLGYNKNYLEHIDVVEKAARASGDKRSLCRILSLRTVSHLEFGEWSEAVTAGEEWRTLATVLGYRADLGYALVNLAAARMETASDTQAQDDLEEARSLAAQEPGGRLELAVHSCEAAWHARNGRPEAARQSLESSIAISRRMQADHETAIAMWSCANLAAQTPIPIADRVALLGEALRLLEQTGDAQRAAMVAESMGDVLAAQPGGLGNAITCYRRAMANWRLRNVSERSDMVQEKLQRCASAFVGKALPTLLQLIENAASSQPVRDLLLEDARTRSNAVEPTLEGLAASLEREFGATAGMSLMMRLHAAGVQAADDQPRVAAHYHGAAYRLAVQIHDLQSAGAELNDLAVLAAGERAFTAARRYYEQSMALALESGNRREEVTCLFNLGCLAVRQRQIDEALALLATAAERATAENLLYELATIAQHLGGIRRDRREFAEALRWFEQAKAIFRDMGEIDDMVGALIGLGKTYRELKQPARSVHARTEAARLLEAQGKPGVAASFYLLAANSLVKELQQPQGAVPLLERALELSNLAQMTDQMAEAQRLIEECRRA